MPAKPHSEEELLARLIACFNAINDKKELIDYAVRSGAPDEVIENLQEIEDEGDVYESIEDLWPDYPSKEDFLWNEDEY